MMSEMDLFQSAPACSNPLEQKYYGVYAKDLVILSRIMVKKELLQLLQDLKKYI